MNKVASLTLNKQSWFLLLLLSLLWGGSFLFIGISVKSLSPLVIVFLRVAMAAILLCCFSLLLGYQFPKQLKIWRMFFMLGLMNNLIPFLLIVWGQTQLASGLAAIFNASTPIFSVLITGFFVDDESPTTLKLLGAVAGFCGVSLMIGMSIFSKENHVYAQIAILCAAFSYALAAVYARRFKAFDIKPMMIATGQLCASSILIFPFVLVFGNIESFFSANIQTWLAIFALASISTAFAYILYFKILAQAGATNVLLVTLLAPMNAVLLGWIFLNETVDWEHFLGMALIALGVSLIDGRMWQKSKGKELE